LHNGGTIAANGKTLPGLCAGARRYVRADQPAGESRRKVSQKRTGATADIEQVAALEVDPVLTRDCVDCVDIDGRVGGKIERDGVIADSHCRIDLPQLVVSHCSDLQPGYGV
jgi:hypothetical protein